MSAPRLVLRIILATITVLTVGTIAVFGFTIIEPFEQAFGAPAAVGWGDLGPNVIGMVAAGFLGLLLVLIIWFVGSPIQRDKRQQFRR